MVPTDQVFHYNGLWQCASLVRAIFFISFGFFLVVFRTSTVCSVRTYENASFFLVWICGFFYFCCRWRHHCPFFTWSHRAHIYFGYGQPPNKWRQRQKKKDELFIFDWMGSWGHPELSVSSKLSFVRLLWLELHENHVGNYVYIFRDALTFLLCSFLLKFFFFFFILSAVTALRCRSLI